MKTEGVILDTGPLVAYMDASDARHDWAVAQFQNLTGKIITCEAVLTEASHLLRKYPRAQQALCVMVERGSVTLGLDFTLEASAIHGLMKTYADQPMALADACVVRLSELWINFAVLTTDSDFLTYRKNRRHLIPTILPH